MLHLRTDDTVAQHICPVRHGLGLREARRLRPLTLDDVDFTSPCSAEMICVVSATRLPVAETSLVDTDLLSACCTAPTSVVPVPRAPAE